MLREHIEAAYVIEYGLEADDQSSLNLLELISTELDRFEARPRSIRARHHAVDRAPHVGARVGALRSVGTVPDEQ